MKPHQLLSRICPPAWRDVPFFLLALAATTAPIFAEYAPANPRLSPGGVEPRPVITSITAMTNQVSVSWTGFGRPFQLEQKVDLQSDQWTLVGGPTNGFSLTMAQNAHPNFFRVSAPPPGFASADTCLACHDDVHAEWSKTAHAGALEALKKIGQSTNTECLACHTVGYGLPSGYKDEATSPMLAGVQCENCHGPAAQHVKNIGVASKRPVLRLDSEMCGGCHNGDQHPTYAPTYDEWNSSLHAKVNADVAVGFLDANPSNSVNRMISCGACHSGAVRLAMVESAEENEPLELPSGEQAASVAITCTVCHDPHERTAYPAQLRNPVASFKPFTYFTATNFATQYDPEVNVCGQCHNSRGAQWKDTSRSPHHSPQYNMVIGSGGYVETTTVPQAAHQSLVTNQCVQCHMQTITTANPTPANPNCTGHSYQVKMTACAPCHTESRATSKVRGTQADIQQRIEDLKNLLNAWATTKADSSLNKYGQYAWEYSTAGDLANPNGDPNIKGPVSADQAKIPDGIKQARYNLYLVAHDGSYGVHNGKYARYLLQVAEDKVNALLAAP